MHPRRSEDLTSLDASDSKYQCCGLRPWSDGKTGLRPLLVLVLVFVFGLTIVLVRTSFRFRICCLIPHFQRYSRSKSEVVKNWPNFACFWPKKFLGERPPIFFDLDYKFSQFPIMWQSFAAIGRGTSEKAWRKKHNVQNIQPVRNWRSRRPNKKQPCNPQRQLWRICLMIKFVFLLSLVGLNISGFCWIHDTPYKQNTVTLINTHWFITEYNNEIIKCL